MRILLIVAIGISLIQLLYVALGGFSSTLVKYNYCYDVVQAARYDVSKPDFTEYSLKSEPECNNKRINR